MRKRTALEVLSSLCTSVGSAIMDAQRYDGFMTINKIRDDLCIN